MQNNDKSKVWIFATQNEHKIKEISELVANTDFLFKSLKDISCEDDIPETSDTIEGNAILKASYIYDKYGLDCFAEDTGLEVTVLNGEPGVKTARYAGETKDKTANMELLLEKLKNIQNREAQFKTVIAAIFQGKLYTFEGVIKGKIGVERVGLGGFGYDPIFIPENSEKTFAEMTSEEKGKISHRGRAFFKFKSFLQNL